MAVLHQLCVSLRSGDAISNQAAALQRVAVAQGIETQAWHLHTGRHPHLPSRPFGQCRSHLRSGDVLLLHYSTASELDDFVREHAAQSAICYHNITPHDFYVPFNPTLAAQLKIGREQLQSKFFGDDMRFYVGTTFNRAELLAWGYDDQQIGQLPYVLSPERVQQAAKSSAGQAIRSKLQGHPNWLYVGRIAPNKRQDAIIRAFACYRQRYEPNAKLWLLGSTHSAGSYLRYVQAHIASLGLQECVHLLSPSDDELGAYYAAADVFVSLSEHEGFGIPLLEAMWMNLPIIALARTAVAETMGEAGVRIEVSSPELVAACAHVLKTRPALRQQIIAAQHQQAERFAPAQAEVQVAQQLQRLIDYNLTHA